MNCLTVFDRFVKLTYKGISFPKVVGSKVGGQTLERWRGMALLFSSRFKLFLKNFHKSFSISHYSHTCNYGNESTKFYTETFTFWWMKTCKWCAKKTELSIKILENDVIRSFLLVTLSNHYLWTSQDQKVFDKGLLAVLCGYIQMYLRNL